MATQHIADEDLEAYIPGQFVAAATMEKHLLVCAHCLERLAEWEWKIIRQSRRTKKKTK
jgi:anti-sigma factor RsiW